MEGYNIPFAPNAQLCNSLEIQGDRIEGVDGKNYLPSQPSLSLNDSEVLPFVEEDLHTPLLDQMSPWLWLLATPKSTHVTPLHANMVKGRNIVITEDPELHLVWYSDKVFIKPVPSYLLSYAFWSAFLLHDKRHPEQGHGTTRLRILQAALGYMRTYLHLIKHESDLRVAKREHLIPEDLDFERWTAFIANFKYIEDWQVAGRYHYGDLRLTRLNFWVRPILRRWKFRKEQWQYSDYFARYVAPLFFIFTTWTVVLDSMQVGLSSRPQWTEFASVSAWFSVVTLASVAAVAVFLLGVFGVLAGREIIYALRKQIRKRFVKDAWLQRREISKKELD